MHGEKASSGSFRGSVVVPASPEATDCTSPASAPPRRIGISDLKSTSPLSGLFSCRGFRSRAGGLQWTVGTSSLCAVAPTALASVGAASGIVDCRYDAREPPISGLPRGDAMAARVQFRTGFSRRHTCGMREFTVEARNRSWSFLVVRLARVERGADLGLRRSSRRSHAYSRPRRAGDDRTGLTVVDPQRL